MTEVLTGKGPQPPAVYWIRRGIVVVGALAVIGLLVWMFSPKGQPVTATPAAPSSPTPSPSAPSSPTPSPSTSRSPSASPSSSPTAPVACEPMGVQLGVKGFRTVKVGSKQVFTLTAENNTALPCIMEIAPSTYSLRVSSGTDPIWTTAHCDKWLPAVKKQTVKAGAVVEFQLTWTLHRSSSGCKQAEDGQGAGTYVATATYRESSAARFAFTLAK